MKSFELATCWWYKVIFNKVKKIKKITELNREVEIKEIKGKEIDD